MPAMRTIVITGGTDGIGRYLAQAYAERGDRVVVIGRNAEKGKAFLERAGGHGVFLPADLGSLEQNRAVLDELRAGYPVIDALVLCARFFRSNRVETEDGIEATFAHFYLSRFLFGHELHENLERAARPVIVNVAGPGGDLSAVSWNDIQLTQHYTGGGALGQGGKLNDLLGVAYVQQYPTGKTRYVLVHPGVTATAQTGDYDRATQLMVENLRRYGKPIPVAAAPIFELVDSPPADPLTAVIEGRRINVTGRAFDPTAARTLDALTRELITPRP
ncbi:SDR family NAD(P)-dependent oxidoreductase [Nocardia sp. NBC_01388]|uniref:SDR family NAD(P)-dependent oxidoreductase n=1 Tax=Nocardia sp. NBC_01388 TaxID=2903596 RepID=UPI00324FA69B